MTQATQITAELETFLRRALPHFMSGKSVEDSLRAVLDDDARLVTAAFTRGTSQYFPTADDRGLSRATGERVGDCIASEISRTVYDAHCATVSA